VRAEVGDDLDRVSGGKKEVSEAPARVADGRRGAGVSRNGDEIVGFEFGVVW